MAFEWFRSWHGAPTDSKFLLIAKRAQVAPGMVSAVYWALLDYASQNEPRGSVEGFDTETYAEWAGCTPEPRSHAPTIYQLQNVVDQGVNIQ